VLDFRSALYLGMTHPHGSLRPWNRLTTGRPAALAPPPEAAGLARSLARLTGAEAATLATSTLHLFWDLFEALAQERIALYLDSGVYPVVRWGAERAAAKGAPMACFPEHDPAALERLLRRDRSLRCKPVVVADGLSPASGLSAPLAQYLKLVRRWGGYLAIDDTQALGILGHRPDSQFRYGRGGGGTPAWHGIQGPDLIVGSSLAKGFGAPLAMLAGSREAIERFEALASTRVHCSPPSAAVISAAEAALRINQDQGDGLRLRLLARVRRFRQRLRELGLASSGGFFPVQTLKLAPNFDAVRWHEQLLNQGVGSVLQQSRTDSQPRISFLITALHTPSEIDQCVTAIKRVRIHALCQIGGKNHESVQQA
jgi:8-amino-7-oxononanoate synthase